jgi:predicted transcriptional regulator
MYRSNIESAHGREVERLRKEYSQEDKELIEKCLEAKRIFNMKLESLAQELDEKRQLTGKLGMTYSLHVHNWKVYLLMMIYIQYGNYQV